MYLREDAIVEVCDRRRLSFSRAEKASSIRAISRLAAACPSSAGRPWLLGLAPQQRSAISLERFDPASRVLLQLPREAERGRRCKDRQSRASDRALRARQPDMRQIALPVLWRNNIGPGRFGVSGAVQMFCAQHRIIDEDRSCRSCAVRVVAHA